MTTGKVSPRDTLAERIRHVIGADRTVREVRMFGGLAFMVDDRMAVSAGREGDLLVRVDPDNYQELLGRGGSPAFMGKDRPMGSGWLQVAGEQLHDRSALARWVAIGIDSRHVQT